MHFVSLAVAPRSVLTIASWPLTAAVHVMASIWSMEGLETARSVDMKRYKIAHQIDIDDPIVDEIVSDIKETFWSGQKGTRSIIKGIFCTKGYPSYPPVEMPDEFDEYYGYSSHMHGFEDALEAVSRGAQYIEKHVTLNKADTSLRDNAFALSFEEFGNMVTLARLR